MKMVKFLPRLNRIYQDNALSFLGSLPEESINMVITSPPYWGLRDYGVEPQIWNGDEKCKHLWGKRKKTLTHKSGESNPGKEGWYKDKGASDDSGSEFCIKCNAWRGSLGLEPTFNLYLKHLGDIFDEIKRVLKKEGTCWVNMGDTFGGSGAGTGSNINNSKESYQLPKGKARASKLRGTNYQKCLLQIPSRFAIEMVSRGWILRNEIIWHKPNAMPSSVKDRFTVDYEKLFFFTKSKKYYFETQYEPHQSLEKEKKRNGFNKPVSYNSKYPKGVGATQRFFQTPRSQRYNRQGRNMRCVWQIPTKPFSKAHFATYPEKLIETPIKAGCPENGIVLDVFMGAGTTALVAMKLNRNFLGCELNLDYINLAEVRLGLYQDQVEQLKKAA